MGYLEYLLPGEAARDALLQAVTQGSLATRSRAGDRAVRRLKVCGGGTIWRRGGRAFATARPTSMAPGLHWRRPIHQLTHRTGNRRSSTVVGRRWSCHCKAFLVKFTFVFNLRLFSWRIDNG